jgi:hypothetical protein
MRPLCSAYPLRMQLRGQTISHVAKVPLKYDDADQENAYSCDRASTLVVDVRDAPEVSASGKIAGAVNVSRGMLEFRADPDA